MARRSEAVLLFIFIFVLGFRITQPHVAAAVPEALLFAFPREGPNDPPNVQHTPLRPLQRRKIVDNIKQLSRRNAHSGGGVISRT